MTIYKIDNVNDEKVLNEFRKHLIAQFENQATGKRVAASLAKIKHETDKNIYKAESYDFVVQCLREIQFKT